MANLQIIRELSREKKISLKELAGIVGITEQGLQKIIRDNSTKVDTMESIAKALQVPISVFFDDMTGNNTASGTQSIAGHGNTISGNVNVTLPEKGFQKIIRSDGSQTTVEVTNPSGDGEVSRDFAAEIMALQKENSDLKTKIIELQGRLLEGK